MGEGSLLGGSKNNLFVEGTHLGNFMAKEEEPKSVIKIGKERPLYIYTDAKFNKLQKKMWKFLLNIEIEEVK